MKIITHDGIFHADEVFAIAVLSICYDNDIEIVRTRDEKIIRSAKYNENIFILDVGGEYDIRRSNYDHHQKDFEMRNIDTKILYSTAGLIWKNYGSVAIIKIVPEIVSEVNHSDFDLYMIEKKVYKDIVSVIDAGDNGEFENKEKILINNKNAIDISKIVSIFNPNWDDEMDENAAFNEAVNMCVNIIKRYVKKEYSIIKAKKYINRNLIKIEEIDSILILDRFIPWKQVFDKENLYYVNVVIYPNTYGTQYIAESVKDFDGKDKFSFPYRLRGQPKERLIELTGYKSIEFVHRTGFLAVFNDKDELIEFVRNLV